MSTTTMPNLDSPFGCKCLTLAQHVTGGGCDECRPNLFAEFLEPEDSDIYVIDPDKIVPVDQTANPIPYA